MRHRGLALALAGAAALASPPLHAIEGPPAAAGAAALPPAAQAVDIDEHLGRAVDRALLLVDHEGQQVRLGDLLDGRRPVVLVLAYYRCPMLCGLVLRGLVDELNQLDDGMASAVQAITVSIDPRDTPAAAAAKRHSTLAGLAHGGEDPHAWPFLVGPEAAVARLADELGFRYAYDAHSDQYAHPAAVMVLTPDGRVSRYLYGTSARALDLRLALVEAGQGKVGGIVDRVIMTCYRYDPAARAYGPYIVGFVRLGGVLILVVVAATVGLLFRRERRAGGRGRTS